MTLTYEQSENKFVIHQVEHGTEIGTYIFMDFGGACPISPSWMRKIVENEIEYRQWHDDCGWDMHFSGMPTSVLLAVSKVLKGGFAQK